MSNRSRHIEVTYCDDIREEVGNKMSFMGVYGSELTIPSVPVVLPKLCIAVKVVAATSDPIETLEVRILILKGEEETELLSTGVITPPEEQPWREDGSKFMVVQLTFMLAPFQIDEESVLRVKAITEKEEMCGLGLQLRTLPPSNPTLS